MKRHDTLPLAAAAVLWCQAVPALATVTITAGFHVLPSAPGQVSSLALAILAAGGLAVVGVRRRGDMRHPVRCTLAACALLCWLANSATATVTVTAGNHTVNMLPPGQVIQVLISSDIGQGIQSADLGLEIGGGVSGPLIMNVDMTSPGTIFGDAPGGNAGQSDFEPFLTRNQLSSISTVSGDTPSSGVLANITIDPHQPGTFPFRLTYTPFFLPTSTSSIPFQPTVLVEGSIFVSPEPGSLVLGGFAMGTLGLLAIRRSRRRNR